MKKIFIIFLSIITILTITSCKSNINTSGTLKLVIADESEKVYSVSINEVEINEGVISILKYLNANEGLNYEIDITGMLLKIGSLNPDSSKNEFITILTSVESDFSAVDWTAPIIFDSQTLKSSSKGLKEMTICDGAIIYFKIEKW